MQAHSHDDSYDLDCIRKVKTITQIDWGAVIWREAATRPNRKSEWRGGGKGRNKPCQSELMQRWSQNAQRCRLNALMNVSNVYRQTAQVRSWTESWGFCWKHPETHRL